MESTNTNANGVSITGFNTTLHTYINTLNTLLGVGILSTPYALSQGGWLCLSVLFVTALICCYTGLLLKRCMDSNPNINTYSDISLRAFGRKGRILCSIFLYMELYLVAVELLILEGDNLTKLFPGGHRVLGKTFNVKQGFVILATLLVLPTTWFKNLGVLAYISLGGILASMVLVVLVIWIGVFGGVGFNHNGVLFNLKDMSTSMSLFIFCFGGHSVFPTLYNSMGDKHQFSKVLIMSFVVSTIAYSSMAIFGYLMYGGELRSQITLNLPVKELCSQIAIYTTLINPLTKFALIVNPIFVAIEERIQFHNLVITRRKLISVSMRTTLVITMMIVALTFPFFGFVMAFIGSFLIVTLSIVLPCLCSLKLIGVGISNLEKITIGAIVVVGFVVGVIGTFTSVKNIVKKMYD